MAKNEMVVSDDVNKNLIPYSFNCNRIEKKNCKLCESEFREKAEEIYDTQKRKNYSAIKKRLKDEDNFDISVNAIKNHINYHHKAVQNNISLKEYSEDIQKWVNMQTNRVSSLKSRIAILEREMFMIAQAGEDLDIIERRKNAETIKKLAETILTYESKLSELNEEAKPVNLIFNQLKIIVNDEMAHIESIKTKKVLSTVLHRLKDSVGELMVG